MNNDIKMPNRTIQEQLSQLEDFEIELTQQEQRDLDELVQLLENQKKQQDLSKEIWSTIQRATIDSIEQIVGLSDRGDWRPDLGAVVTTPLNFRNGVVVSEADKQRFQMWQDRLNGNAPSASEFREDSKRFKYSFEKAKKAFKDSKRNPDGSYNNDYNDTIMYDQNDPRTYKQPDSSGDMVRDTTKTINVDHINSVKKNYEDDKVALYGGATPERFDETMREVSNNEANFAISDEHANKSMKDRDALEVAETRPDLNMNPEKVKAKQVEADNAKNKILFKHSIKEKSVDFAMGIGKSTLAATGKMLVGKAMKIAVSETVVEFQQKSEEKLLDRVKRVIKNIIERAKGELGNIWQEIKDFAINNALSEIVNLILNYFVSTVKNVFKLIRCLFGSIISAFKIIFDSSKPWEERLFEALKIISAGLAMATGTMLNELITKAIETYIPFLAAFAGDIAAVVSGLISSILSALVLMSFDRYKANIRINDEERQIQLIGMHLTSNTVALTHVSTLKAKTIVAQTTDLILQELSVMTQDCREIDYNMSKFSASVNRLYAIKEEIENEHANIVASQNALNSSRAKGNFIIDNKLSNLPRIDNE